VFKSSFHEAGKKIPASSTCINSDFVCRRRVEVEDTFDLIHNILYYLHTDQIAFCTDLTYIDDTCLPKLCTAEDIYAISDRLLLDDLKGNALDFLRATCTIDNITARTMSEFAMTYKEVGTMYANYYQTNWKKVRLSKAHADFFAEMEEVEDTSEHIKSMQRYRQVMEDAMWR
jgi:hypothetical protein